MKCPICLDDIDKLLFVTSCLHSFHPECIYNSLRTSKNCPLCRNDINNGLHMIKNPKRYAKLVHKENISTGYKWTLLIDFDGNTIGGLPLWFK